MERGSQLHLVPFPCCDPSAIAGRFHSCSGRAGTGTVSSKWTRGGWIRPKRQGEPGHAAQSINAPVACLAAHRSGDLGHGHGVDGREPADDRLTSESLAHTSRIILEGLVGCWAFDKTGIS